MYCTERRLGACPDCGLIQTVPPLPPGALAECPRCAHTLAFPHRGGLERSLALATTALLLLSAATLLPLLTLTSFGRTRVDWLPSGVETLWRDGYASLATVVFLFSLAIPILYLCLHVGVLLALRVNRVGRLGRLFRWTAQLRPWAMIEVFLLGACVAYSRLEAIGPVSIDSGGWCLIGAALAMLLAASSLAEQSVWNALPVTAEAPSSQEWIACSVCSLVRDASRAALPCPRCEAPLHPRKPLSMQRTLALVLAGTMLYAPAMLLPVLRIENMGREESSTIISGVRQLASSGLWALALIVFTASILVPLLKLAALGLMLALTGCRSGRWLRGRMRLYRLIESVGRWSSIDLFMISILAALVRFGTLTSVRPDSGALAFAAVVVLTMFASRSFDPRIMWDAADRAP